jgi:hypothetical protein
VVPTAIAAAAAAKPESNNVVFFAKRMTASAPSEPRNPIDQGTPSVRLAMPFGHGLQTHHTPLRAMTNHKPPDPATAKAGASRQCPGPAIRQQRSMTGPAPARGVGKNRFLRFGAYC